MACTISPGAMRWPNIDSAEVTTSECSRNQSPVNMHQLTTSVSVMVRARVICVSPTSISSK